MELAIGALSSIGAGIGSAAGAIGAGASSLIGALGSAPVLTALAGATTAVSVIQQLRQGDMKAEQAQIESQVARSEAIGEQATGAQRSATIQRAMLRTLGENDVAYAASGIDISYGEAATTRDRTLERGYSELSIDRSTSDARAAGYGARSIAYDRMSRQYRSGATLAALATAGEGLMRMGRRGVT